MHWDKATVAAGTIAQGWTREAGPGGAILLFDADGIRSEACGGMACIELGIPFAPDTVVRYASISKHFLCALLAVENDIGLDDPLGAHLALQPALAAVPVGRALDMTGGLPDTMECGWLLGASPTTTQDRHALLRFVQSLEGVNFPAGSEISYSNTGYRLVQAALEAKGIDYRAALKARFFVPLGLGIDLPEDEAEPVPNLATGYWRSATRGWLRGRYGMHFSASGGLTGSAQDLAAWARGLMTGRSPAEGLLAKLGARRHLLDGRPTGYGLGLARSPLPGAIALGHGGSLPGFKNHFLIAPEIGAGVVVLSNREETDAHGIALQVLAALTGATLPEPALGALPQGLFVSDDGFWLECAGGKVTFLGAQDTVYPAEDGGVEGRSVHMPVHLRLHGGTIECEIGHVARRFRPVAPGLTMAPGWAGRWVCPAQNATFDIALDGDTATLHLGAGPLQERHPLTPIADHLAMLERGGGGPWKQRVCLERRGDVIRLITNRSRMLQFTRG